MGKGQRYHLAMVFLVSIFLCVGLTLPAQARDRLVIATWGGPWEESLNKHVLNSFKKEYDVEVVIHRQTSASDTLAKLVAEKNNPTIDIYFGVWGGMMALVKQGIAVEITQKDVPDLVNLSPNLVGKQEGKVYLCGIHPYKPGLTVRRDLVKVPKEVTLKWLQDSSLKGLIALPRFAWTPGVMLTHFAMVGGGNERNIDPGFDFARKVAPNVRVLYNTTGESIRLLTSGEVAIAYTNSGVPATLLESGLDVGFYQPKDVPVLPVFNGIFVIKGGPGGKELAVKFLKYFMDPVRVGNYHTDLGFGSPNVKSPPAPKDKVPFPLTSAEIASAYFMDDTLVDKNFDKWHERWNREIIPAIGK